MVTLKTLPPALRMDPPGASTACEIYDAVGRVIACRMCLLLRSKRLDLALARPIKVCFTSGKKNRCLRLLLQEKRSHSKHNVGVVGMLLIFCESFLPTSLLALTHSHTHTTPKKGIQKTDWRHTTACDGAMRSVASRAPDERVGFAQIVCEIVSRLCAHRALSTRLHPNPFHVRSALQMGRSQPPYGRYVCGPQTRDGLPWVQFCPFVALHGAVGANVL